MKITKLLFIPFILMLLFGCELEEKEFIKPKPIALDPNLVSTTKFEATWTEVPGYENYFLDVATDEGFVNLLLGYNGKSINATSHLVENLEIAQPYFYRVRVWDGANSFSNVIKVATKGLFKPVFLTETHLTTNSVVLNWEPLEGVENYYLDIAKDQNFSSYIPGYQQLKTDTLSNSVENLQPSTSYYIRLRGKRGPNFSLFSDTLILKTHDFEIPKALYPLDISLKAFTSNWNTTPGAKSYLLDVSEDEFFSSKLQGYDQKVVTDTFQLINNLEIDKTYYYRIKAKNGEIISDYSNTIAISTTPFEQPVATEASDIELLNITVNWKEVNGATSYLLDVATDSEFNQKLTGYQDKEVFGTAHEVTNLEVNKTYYYRLRAKNRNSISNYSNIVSGKTNDFEQPVALGANENTLVSFQANWLSVDGADKYLIDVAKDISFNDIISQYNNYEISSTTLKIENLDVNQKYFFRIRAKRGNSISAYSNIIETQTDDFDQPVAINASDIELQSFRANWLSLNGATSYLLQVATDSLFNNVLSGFDWKAINGTNDFVTGLKPNTSYFFRVKGKRENYLSAASNTMELKTEELKAPIAVEVTLNEYWRFKAQWETVSGADTYIIDVGTDSSFNNLVPELSNKDVGLVNSIEISYPTFNVNGGNQYYYRVKAVKEGITSSYSNLIGLTTPKIPKPVLDDIQQTYPLSAQDALEIHFKFDETSGNTAYNEFGTNNGALKSFNGSQWVTGNVDGGLRFDGNNDWINLTSGGIFEVAFTEKTVALWVKADDNNGIQQIYDEGGSYNGMAIRLNGDKVEAVVQDDDVMGIASLPNFGTDWHHVAAVFAGTEIRLYVDGEDVDITPVSFLLNEVSNHSDDAGLGKRNGGDAFDASGSSEFGGIMDDLRIFDKALSVDQIKALVSIGNSASTAQREIFKFETTWDAIDNIDGYLIDVATDPSFSNMLPDYDSKEITLNSLWVEGLEPNTKYYLKIRAKQGSSVSSYSLVKEITTNL